MHRIKLLVIALLTVISIMSYSQEDSQNILLICVDDMADWVGCMDGYNGEVKTPNIDNLAQRGVLFTNAHCASPICGPSRAAILTGLRPEISGIYHNVGRYSDYTDAEGFPLYFRQNGYTSLGAGKVNHGYGREIYENWDDYGPDTRHIGGPVNEEEMNIEGMDPTKYIKRFDVSLPQNPGALIDRPFNKYSTWDYCAFDLPDSEMPDGRIALWGVDQLHKKHDKPFLIACGFYRPHQPFYVPKKYFDMYDLNDIEIPETIVGDMLDIPNPGIALAHGAWSSGKHETCLEYDQWKPLVRGYLAAISFADAQVGKLLDALDKGENGDNTWIVFLSDHGWHLGEKEHWGKHTPWRNSTRVPLIIIPPKGKSIEDFKPGTTCDAPVNLLDIYPTLIDIADLPEKRELSGKSLLPLIANPDTDWDEATVITIAHGNHAIHTKEWSYIHYYDGSEELYNTMEDPEEWENLANLPEFGSIIKKLKKHIPKDRYKQFVRYGYWKACVLNSGEVELFNVQDGEGIAEQINEAGSNPKIVEYIADYLLNNRITDSYVNIPDQIEIEVSLPQRIFTSGEDGVAEFRIPSMITTEKGTILTVCDGRVDRPGDVPNNIDLVTRRFEKGSREWTPIKRAVNFAGDHGACDPSLVQDRITERIFLFYGFCPGRNDVTEGSNRERRHLMLQYVYSDDDGQSWSTPVHVDYDIRENDWQSVWSSPGRGLQLKSGRLVVPCTVNKTSKEMVSYLVYSDDKGDTWQCQKVAANINEPAIVEMANGDLLINARNQIKPGGFRAITKSNDGGNTWSTPIADEQLPDPNCQGSIIQHVLKQGKKEKELLILSNNATSKGRKNLTLKISTDQGKTWKYEKLIHLGPSAYSCLTISPKGNIGLLYENGKKSPYEGISYIEISLIDNE